MEMAYTVLLHKSQYHALYDRLREENLLWAVWPDVDAGDWTPDVFINLLSRPDTLVLGGAIDGAPAGVMTLRPVTARSLTAEIGLTAFRHYFARAEDLCRGALLWACEHLDVASFLGRVAIPNRHILRMLSCLGFRELGRVPGMCWYTRKQKCVDGALVLATPDSIRATIKREG